MNFVIENRFPFFPAFNFTYFSPISRRFQKLYLAFKRYLVAFLLWCLGSVSDDSKFFLLVLTPTGNKIPLSKFVFEICEFYSVIGQPQPSFIFESEIPDKSNYFEVYKSTTLSVPSLFLKLKPWSNQHPLSESLPLTLPLA